MAADKKTFVNDLKNALPQCIRTDEEASEVITIVGTVITNAMKNRDSAYLDGIGEWKSVAEGGRKKIVFTPDRVLEEAANE